MNTTEIREVGEVFSELIDKKLDIMDSLEHLIKEQLKPVNNSLERLERHNEETDKRLNNHIEGEIKQLLGIINEHCNKDTIIYKEEVKEKVERKRYNYSSIISVVALVIALLGIFVGINRPAVNASPSHSVQQAK